MDLNMTVTQCLWFWFVGFLISIYKHNTGFGTVRIKFLKGEGGH